MSSFYYSTCVIIGHFWLAAAPYVFKLKSMFMCFLCGNLNPEIFFLIEAGANSRASTVNKKVCKI